MGQYAIKLTVGEAFKLCRYEWMRSALDQFLRVLSKKMEQREREILMEPPSVPVTEHRIVPPNCFVTPCGSQPLDETYDCVVAGLVDPSSVPVPEHPVLPPNCYVKKPPGSPHLDEPHDCVVQG
uniref:Uncharacterized protein n=1 Tax=Nelumbo nucifera TaxID=4432 RepID=A0A822YN92_NELNU|nr:TPA_asm: hypothetical protein HUJ06_004700 [Nelumbo nucifera]